MILGIHAYFVHLPSVKDTLCFFFLSWSKIISSLNLVPTQQLLAVFHPYCSLSPTARWGTSSLQAYFAFLCPRRSKIGGHIVFVLSVCVCVCVCLSVCLCVRNFNLGRNFCHSWHTPFIFDMWLPCDKTFHLMPYFDLCDLDLGGHAHFSETGAAGGI